jgi:YVTN family beta-propeller protein
MAILAVLTAGAAQAQWLEATIPAGSEPYALCYNTLNDRVYCANAGDSSVTVIDGVTNQVVTTVAAGSRPYDLCYNSQDNKVYCANWLSADVTVIDGATNQVITTVAAGGLPSALCYNPQNDKVYCANNAGDNVTVISGTTNHVITNVDLGMGSTPRALCYNILENKVYVAMGHGAVAVIDGRIDQILATLGACDAPQRLCYNPDNNEVYCRSGLLQSPNDAVWAFDGRGDTFLYAVGVGLSGGAIAYYHGTGKAYCANPDSNSVSVIDPVSRHVILAVPACQGSCALGYSATNSKVYSANGADSTVTAIDGVTNSVLKTIAVGVSPIALAYNPVQNRIYVANRNSNSVSVIRDSAVGVGECAPSNGRRLSLEAYLNPFRGQIRLRLTATGLCPEVRIYGANGSLVRDLDPARFLTPSLVRSLAWDGTDGMGRKLPAGVYIVRLTDGTDCLNRKVLLLR